ncbi:SpaH/EbpB family LPXTG-anchored major pilin [Turicibacter sanguinis]|uniref:SpaH/EbpB family LPXTG-anchored major pilin n=1 Tax=Turicibacter sanguinis TaxID=154288 RepID=UPI003999ACE3
MKRCNVLKKCFAVMMSLALLLTMIPTSVFATTIDGSKTGSLTINKYDSNYSETNKTPIEGVTFTIYKIFSVTVNSETKALEYKITDDFVQFFTNKELTVEDVTAMDGTALEALKTELKAYVVTKNLTGISETTDKEGQAKFENLDLGYYLVDETAYPDQVVTPAAPFLVSVPMTNEAGTDWVYDVVANPKNVTSTTQSGLTLTKYGKVGNAEQVVLPGATFKLEKQNADGSWSVVEEALVTDGKGQISVANLTRGQYRFVEIAAPEGYILDTTVNYNFEVRWNEGEGKLEYFYNDVASDGLNVVVVNEKPTIDKEVTTKNDVNIGDSVNWTIKATVPSTINKLEKYVITDTLSEGLTYDATKADVKVTLDGVEFTAYTLTPNGQTLTFTFDHSKLVGGKEIVITYNTTVNEKAVVGGDGNSNHVELDYSNSTATESDTSTDKPEVDPVVYTFGLEITKINNAKEKLAGAVFNLYKADGTTLIKSGLTTDENGVVKFDGLAVGTYVLVETKAPSGYNLLNEPIKFTIEASYDSEGRLTTSNTVNGYFGTTVINKKGFTLPATGGMGTVIFTIGGLSLMALAGGAYVASKRKESK